MKSDQSLGPQLEIAHVLFMDIVSYSKLPMDQQQKVVKTLQDAVRSTSDFRRAQEREQLIRLPTGDGMALVFFGSPEAAARCAIELSRILRDKPEVPLRIGLHTGPVYRIADINANRNVSGGGINMAQRVMDCGDAGHILVSATAAEMLGQLSNWADTLHELGEAEVKHGVKVHVWNLYNRDAGNPELPKKFAGKPASASGSRGSGASTSQQSLIGATLGHYKIVQTLGFGGMGVVYEAEDTRLGRHVALKMLPEHLMQDEMALERFRREATLASGLNHPNICTLHDIGFEAGQHFIVLELLEGESLKARIERGAVPLEQLVEWGIQIADALDAAHQAGIVHRDIKPGNIFVTKRDNVKLVDFGLAKLSAKARSAKAGAGGTVAMSATDIPALTSPGTPLGTIAYMSPEQARGEDLDARTDIFSFGAVLYEMATGRSPFAGTTTAVVFDSILNKAAPPISAADPSLPPALQKIVTKTLEKDRDARYRSAAEIRDALKVLRGATTKLKIAPPAERRGPVALKLAMGAAAVVIVGAIGWEVLTLRQQPKSQPASEAKATVAATARPAAVEQTATTQTPSTEPSRPAEGKSESLSRGRAASAAAPASPTSPAKQETVPPAEAQRRPATQVGRATGQFSGRLKNTTMGAEAPATVIIGEENGLITGCLQVSPPLGGSGPLSGVATGNQVLLNSSYRGGRIEFRGQLSSADEFRGTYTVFGTNSRIEQGSFTFSRRSAQGPAAGFDSRSCPQ